MGKYSQTGRPLRIRVGSLDADALLLEKVSGIEGVSRPFRYELEMLAERPVDFNKTLGEPATVTIALTNGTQRTIHGIVRRLTQGIPVPGPDGDRTFLRYRAELVPTFALLAERVQSRVFQHQSIKDILTQVLVTEWQLDTAIQLAATYYPRTFCVQYGESDLAFVSRLMEEEGIAYFFEFSESGHKLHLVDDPAFFADVAAPGTVVFDASGGPVNHPRVRDWEKSQALCASKYTHRDYSFEMPDHDLTTDKQVGQGRTVEVGTVTHALAHPREVGGKSLLERYEYPGNFAHRYDAIDKSGGNASGDLAHIADDRSRLAQVRLEEQLAQSLLIRGAGDCGNFIAGHKFALEHHYESAEGAGDHFLLTQVELTASLQGAYTGAEPGPFVYDNRFECIPGQVVYRPARVTPRPRVCGPETAVVVGPAGEEIHCDKFGRIKVQFRWDRDPQAGDSSCWVRVAQPWAGKTWGALTLPRVGQEVVIGFEGGNPDRPLIQGSLYNAEQMPPYQLPDQRRQSGLVSSSGQAADQYHELRFDDTDGQELLHIHSEKDMNQESENDHTVKVGNDHSMTVNNDQAIQVGNNHAMNVGGSYSLHIAGGSGGGTGSGSGGGVDFEGGVAPATQKNVMETFVDGNAFFCFLGGREEMRLGLQTNLFLSGAMNLNIGAYMTLNIGAFFTVNGPRQFTVGFGTIATIKAAKETRVTALSRLQVLVDNQAVTLTNLDAKVEQNRVTINDTVNTLEENVMTVVSSKANSLSNRVDGVVNQQNQISNQITAAQGTHATLGARLDTIAGAHNRAVAALRTTNVASVLQDGALILT